MQILLQDLRYGARMLLKNSGFMVVAVITLSLGVAANTAVFTLVNAALFKPMPVREPERLVALYTTDPNSRFPGNFSFPDYRDYRDHNEVFSDLFVHLGVNVSLRESRGKAELIWGELVTSNYFTGLGVAPELGRMLAPADETAQGAPPIVVLNHSFWKRRFGGDPGVVGRVVKLNGFDFTIIGVAREGFSGTRFLGYIPDVWIPLMIYARLVPDSEHMLEDRGFMAFNVNGRLKPGVTIAQATAAMDVRARQLAQAYPRTNTNIGVGMVPGSSKTNPVIARMGFLPIVAGLIMGLVSLVLLVACANVANLLLAQASTRRREIAIRLALGASRWRLIRQLLTETMMLSVAGGALGLLLASWATEIVPMFDPELDFATMNYKYDLSLDYRILGFTLLVSILTGVIFGLAPALEASKPDLVTTLKGEATAALSGRRRFSLRDLLVVSQVALSLMLLVCAGLFVKSMRNAQELNPGFETKRILLSSVNVSLFDYSETKGRNFYKQALERIRALPDVEAASLAAPLPLDAYTSGGSVVIEGYIPRDENERIAINHSIVGHDYFQTMNTPIVEGRAFTDRDNERAPRVVIVNETMARHYWPNQNPIGKRIHLDDAQSPALEVVGVAKDGKYLFLGEPPTEYLFLPFQQNYRGQMTLIARAAGRPEAVAASIRQEVANIDGELPVYSVKTMPKFLDRLLNGPKSVAVMVSIFGVIALLMAAVGLYGVISYLVAQRMREIGIRMALGANAADVLRLIVQQGMRLAMVGVAIGVTAAAALAQLMKSLLYGVSGADPTVFVVVSLTLVAATLLACYLPARRATKVDPMIALRCE
jgi:putative ABC transport system permease protein